MSTDAESRTQGPQSRQINRPTIARLQRILAMLQTDDRPNCRSIAYELEVSPKTVQRDIDFLRDQMDIPLDYDPKERGFYLTKPTRGNFLEVARRSAANWMNSGEAA